MGIRFEDLIVWQKARALTREVYRVTREPPFAADHALRSQIRRAAASIGSNIAEGFERRDSRAEFARFLMIARGSCGEVRSQLYIAEDQRYLTPPDFERISAQAVEISRMLFGLTQAVRANRPP